MYATERGKGAQVRLRVALTTTSAGDGRGSVCIAVDVVRASTTILTLVEAGVSAVRFAVSLDEARARAEASTPRALLVGEQGGIIAPGFDLDNSPLAVRRAPLAGRPAVVRTSNGTVLLSRLTAAAATLIGSIRNGAAVIAEAVAEAERRDLDVLICCAGQEHGAVFALDDAIAAGFIVACAWESHGPWAFPEQPDAPRLIDESAMAVLALYRAFVGEGTRPDPDSVARALLQSAGPRFIAATGRLEDVRYCATPHASRVVPRVTLVGGEPTVRGIAPPAASPTAPPAVPPTRQPAAPVR